MAPEVAKPTTYAHVHDHLVCYAGRGQYSENGGGGSSCGLAALNCARVVLGLEQGGSLDEESPSRDDDILDKMIQDDITEEILRPCSRWSQTAHLSVSDIYKTPIFHKSLKLLHSSYGRSRLQEFKQVLSRLSQTTQTIGASASVVITRPPEIISCLKLVTTRAGKDTFVVYDSHPRPDHPDGAAFIIFKSLDDAASYLAQLMSFDESLLADDEAQWQVQYLAQFSAHIFAAREMPFTSKDLEDATLEASVDILSLKAKDDKRPQGYFADDRINEARTKNIPTRNDPGWLQWGRGYFNAVEPCGHQFCRDCISGCIAAKIEEHQYPSSVRRALQAQRKGSLEQLGLTEEQYKTFNEMQMAAFSVQNAMFVDKAEFATTDILICPLPGCRYQWCKQCSQEVVDGCQTPAEKIAGCNHMTCPSPGCNTYVYVYFTLK
ncbi:uncharacterized protein B0H18DRAFT_949678 [Fomitopsis serialis]|uniref:uncharacterized protein n=1 Tax=Fomitopsis serialis TaxID=139415 RepID=UPI00200725A4|nr:uncharacterized protein B0H18DRAFT_949678 [Neoantrodia serialis]KAH9938289.1 hypothetical protein B0H18DRAFT_949678 [Neoantrodia serialis]